MISTDFGMGATSANCRGLRSLIPLGIFLGIAVPVVKDLLFTEHRCGL